MMSSNHYSSLMNSSSMAYVVNNPIANSVANSLLNAQVKSNSEATSLHEQFARLQETNNSLQRKLQNKNHETEKMQSRLGKLDNELSSYKQLLEQIHQSINNGDRMPSMNNSLQNLIQNMKVKGKKSYAPKKSSSKSSSNPANCSCCYVADKPYACDFESCGKRFRQKAHLEAHRNIHSGRRFICEWAGCGKSFCRKYNLVEHSKMHTPQNPNQCSYPNCGQTFSTKHGLMRHQNAQHMNI